jgi:hypothetical protein
MADNKTTEKNDLDNGFNAKASLAGYTYRAVKLDSDRCVAIAGAGDSAVGIMQNEPDYVSEKVASVRSTGLSYAIAGAVVAAGDLLKVGALGKLVPATTNGDQLIAKAISAGAGDGSTISVVITHGTFTEAGY